MNSHFSGHALGRAVKLCAGQHGAGQPAGRCQVRRVHSGQETGRESLTGVWQLHRLRAADCRPNQCCDAPCESNHKNNQLTSKLNGIPSVAPAHHRTCTDCRPDAAAPTLAPASTASCCASAPATRCTPRAWRSAAAASSRRYLLASCCIAHDTWHTFTVPAPQVYSDLRLQPLCCTYTKQTLSWV